MSAAGNRFLIRPLPVAICGNAWRQSNWLDFAQKSCQTASNRIEIVRYGCLRKIVGFGICATHILIQRLRKQNEIIDAQIFVSMGFHRKPSPFTPKPLIRSIDCCPGKLEILEVVRRIFRMDLVPDPLGDWRAEMLAGDTTMVEPVSPASEARSSA